MLNKFKSLIETKDQKALLKKAFIFSAIFHLAAVIFSEGFHRPDEHLGIFRLMSYKLGNFPESELSWEYGAQIRPWLQPYAFYIIAKVSNFLGIVNPFFIALILRFICSALGFYTLIKFTKFSLQYVKELSHQNLLIILLATMWYLPFFHARTSAENLSLSFFILGLIRVPRLNQSIKNCILAGLFFGISYILRFQTGVMVLFAVLWPLVARKIQIKYFIYTSVSICIAIALSTVIDYLGYGVWTFSSWNYVYQNIFKGVASGFGVSPWYYYFTKSLAKGIPPYSFFLVLPFLWMWIKKPFHFLTWVTLPFFIIHSAIGHKELRFIFALGIFAPVMIGMYLDENKKDWYKSKVLKIFIILAVVVNFTALLISSLKPAYTPISFYKHLYSKEEQVSTLYSLSLIRDELDFYQKEKFEQVYIKENKLQFIESLKNENQEKWIFTSNFNYILKLESIKRCNRDFSSYPSFLIKEKFSKVFKRSKIWTLYKCKN